ncbi:hypothetical protein AGMMS49579_21790 [Spirochaetia bacterium]|nr:hypothetical protein AGMMS49579_21790 [Spirochaetia bacterium]
MKKGSTVFVVLLLAVCGAPGVFAQSGSDFEVTTANGQVTITRYKGNAAAVSIPATIGGKPVVGIGGQAFSDCKDITSVSIPEGVISIGGTVFLDCTGLTSVSISASVTSIGFGAFLGCTGLTSIVVDTNNNHYTSRDDVLFNKKGSQLIQYPAGKQERQYAIPEGVTHIVSWAFIDCTSLSSVSIPGSVTRIWLDAFDGCTALTSIRIGANVALDRSFSNNFDAYYNTKGKKAGLYTFRNGAWSYAAQ